MGAVRDENYVVEHGWMVNRLQLKGNDLRVYAIIYGFSQTSGQEFTGGLQYLADWVNGSKQGVQKNLKALADMGLITKREYFENGVKKCAYRATEFRGGMQQSCMVYTTELHGGMQLSCTGYTTELHGGMQQSCTNNIPIKETDNKVDKKEDNAGVPPTPHAKKKSVKLTAPEIDIMLARYAHNAEQLALLRDWMNVRKAKRAPETEKALTLNLDKLDSLARESGLSVNGYLEAVIARGWAAFYPIREGFGGQARKNDERSRIKTEEEHAAGQHSSGFGW